MENNLEEKLGTILSDPEMMKKIQAMAQSLGAAPPPQQPAGADHGVPQIDPGMLQKLSGLAGQTGIDANQRQLLSALTPYLSQNRVAKLENAMRAAKMARLASTFLGSGGLQMFSGR